MCITKIALNHVVCYVSKDSSLGTIHDNSQLMALKVKFKYWMSIYINGIYSALFYMVTYSVCVILKIFGVLSKGSVYALKASNDEILISRGVCMHNVVHTIDRYA